ncbi:hypothetical protein AZE42_05729 [Rhizopogon vesiculosus]|uniref:DUF6533 domain-containing protein n=1 Tax=Rhizopogon vesiculosus TaxID=180088 RepID=A0A1J8R3R9_9AGAM|nr:hypothetical protein AZE42_05729 [Rhizopogon vesiculosus]
MTDAFRLRMSQVTIPARLTLGVANTLLPVVGLTILSYDYIVTMDKEVRLMWGSKWGVARVLFCISRYLPFIASVIDQYYAFAHLPNPSDYALLTVAFVLEVKAGDTLSCLLTDFHIHADNSSNLADGPPPSPGMQGCYPTQPADVLYMFCMMLVIFESAILLLVLIRVIKHSRRICGVATGLSTSLYRDSLLFVVCLLCMSAINLVVMSTIPPRFNEVFDTLPTIMHSVLASRIMFNIRQSAHCDVVTADDMVISEMESSSPVVLRFSVFGRV